MMHSGIETGDSEVDSSMIMALLFTLVVGAVLWLLRSFFWEADDPHIDEATGASAKPGRLKPGRVILLIFIVLALLTIKEMVMVVIT